MNKADSTKHKKWLKARRRVNKIKKTHNCIAKTHKGCDQLYIDQARMARVAEEAMQKETKKEIAKVMGLNPKEVF